MPDVSSISYKIAELFRGVLERATGEMQGIATKAVRLLDDNQLRTLHRDLQLLSTPSAYDSPTTKHAGMYFVRHDLLNNLGTFIKYCEISMNSFEGIMKSFLAKYYDPMYKDLREEYANNLFEAFWRFAMNQSVVQAKHEDPTNTFAQMKFSVEAMKAVNDTRVNDQAFQSAFGELYSGGIDQSTKEFIRSDVKNAQDLAYAILGHLYPTDKQHEHNYWQKPDLVAWDVDIIRYVSALNSLRQILQEKNQ